MSVSFLVIDESKCDKTGLISMTAILFPIENYFEIRKTMHNFVSDLLPKKDEKTRVINLHPPDLHARALLKGLEWATDEDRLKCFEHTVQLVNQYDLKVFRVSYVTKSLKDLIDIDKKAHGLNLFAILSMAQDHFEDRIIIPLFDGVDEQNAKFINLSSQACNSMVDEGLERAVSYGNSENITEPTFASGKFSKLVQIVDLISYMLHAREDKSPSDFKKRIQKISEKIIAELITQDSSINMQQNN